MIVNRALEAVRRLRPSHRLLRRRSQMVRNRVPVVLIPSILGTRLADGNGGGSWNSIRDLYFGRPVSRATEVRPLGLLEQFTLLPGIMSYDVYGGLVRFLERVGGYERNQDLFVLDYDWRTGIVDGAAGLQTLVQRVRGLGHEKVDLIGMSSGGLIARYFQSYGGVDVLEDSNAAPTGAGARCTRRVVYVGTPQRGSLHAFEILIEGTRLAPLGRHFPGAEIARLQTAWDCLPHPSERVLLDDQCELLDLSLHDPAFWVKFGHLPVGELDLAKKLERARRLHDALDRPFVHRDVFVIAGRNRPTTVRARLSQDHVEFPPCEPQRGDPYAHHMYQSGDNSVSETSVRGLSGIGEDRFWWCKPRAHHLLPADPTVHRLVLEALLVTERSTPPTGCGDEGLGSYA